MRKSPTKEITRWHHGKMLCSFPIIGIWRSHRVSRPPCDSDYCYLNCFRQWHEMVDKRKMFLRNQFWRFLFHQDILQLCSWLSLRFLMPWINHVPPVWRSTFWKSSLNWWWVCKIIKWYIMNCFRQWHEMVDKRKMFLMNQFWRFLFHQDILQLCSWLSLRFLMPWINHVPPVWRSTFWKSSLNWWWVCKIIKWYIMKGSHWSVSMLGLIGSTAASKLQQLQLERSENQQPIPGPRM